MICRSMQRAYGHLRSVTMRDIFIFTTECRMRGIYMVRTKDALGTWEKPVLVLAGKV